MLLANIDAGWLQNPVYYAGAPNKLVIEALPAHHPAQVALAGSFTSHSVVRPALASLAYGAVLLAAAVAALTWRMRVRRAR